MQKTRFIGLLVLRPDYAEADFQSMLRSLTQEARTTFGGQWTARYEKVLRTRESTKQCFVQHFGSTITLDTYWYEVTAEVEVKNIDGAEWFLARNCITCNPEGYPADTEVLYVKPDRVDYLRHHVRKVNDSPLLV